MTTDTPESPQIAETTFSADEARVLEALQSRYRNDHDIFSPRELAHLRFLRWSVDSGRLRTELDTPYPPREKAA
jgi:hypothetical protein